MRNESRDILYLYQSYEINNKRDFCGDIRKICLLFMFRIHFSTSLLQQFTFFYIDVVEAVLFLFVFILMIIFFFFK